jgi:hypothetical protein
MADLTDHEIEIVRLGRVISSCLGALGAFIVIILFLCSKKGQSARSLVFYLCLSNMGKGLTGVISVLYWSMDNDPDSILCLIQASSTQYFDFASILWASCIATYLHLGISKGWPDTKLKKVLVGSIIIGFGLPAISVGVLFFMHGFGKGNPGDKIAWCWIDKDHPMLRASMYYIPLMVIWIYNIVIYFKIMRQVNRYMSFVKKKAYMRLLMFLLVSIVTNLPALVNRIQNIISPHSVFILFLLQATIFPLEGFLDAFVYPSREFLEETCCSRCKKTPVNNANATNNEGHVVGGSTGSLGSANEYSSLIQNQKGAINYTA